MTVEEIVGDCLKDLSKSSRALIRKHKSAEEFVNRQHFIYGMAVRNKYIHGRDLFPELHPDDVSALVLEQIYKKLTMKTVFLGGTCNGSTWREELIPLLKINYFNPVVDDWTEEFQKEEIKQREECDICLYLITSEMIGVYSIAEVIDDSNKRPKKTVFYFEKSVEVKNVCEGPVNREGNNHYKTIEFSSFQIKSLNQVGKLVESNGGFWAKTKEELLQKLNGE